MFEVGIQYFSAYELTPKRFVIKHSHNCYELVYYQSGSGITRLHPAGAFQYEAGQYMIYRPFEAHDEEHRTLTVSYCVGFAIQPETALMIESGLYTDEDGAIWSLIERIQTEIHAKNGYHEWMASLLAAQLLLTHARREGDAKETEVSAMKYIYRYIDENYTQDLSLAQLAKMSGYSVDYFRHRFLQDIGISPIRYIINKRLELAKQLLVHTADSVTDISLACGFANTSQFSASFRKHISVSPLLYRKSHNHIHDEVQNLTGG